MNGTDNTLTASELAQQVARLTQAVNMLLDAGVKGRELAAQTRSSLAARAKPDLRGEILRLLSTANQGKPGHLTTAEIMARTGLTKSMVWHYCQDLNNKDQAIIRRGKTKPGGKRGPDVVYHADAALLT
jgi:hypothetical protein